MVVDAKGSVNSFLSNALLCNTKLLSKPYNELTKDKMKEYKKLTIEDYSKEK